MVQWQFWREVPPLKVSTSVVPANTSASKIIERVTYKKILMLISIIAVATCDAMV
jgi:hypothetical protein